MKSERRTDNAQTAARTSAASHPRPWTLMGIDDQIRSTENRLMTLEKERVDLLGELKKLRAQRDEQKPLLLLGRPAPP